MAPLPWPLNAEIFLPEAKGLAGSIVGVSAWTCTFLLAYFETDLEARIGTYGAYFLYGSCCTTGAAVLALVLPETKGKTPYEIARRWKKT